MDLDFRTHTVGFDGFAERHQHQEWLLTNGTGGYAMGTATGCNTRRYHGLLVAAADPPVGRIVALNQVWDQLLIERHDHRQKICQNVDFATLMFRSHEGQCDHVFAPTGCHMLERFERGLSVRWTYRWGEIELERELFLHWQKQAITLRYQVRGLTALKATAKLRIAPMLTLRDFHSLINLQDDEEYQAHAKGNTLHVTRDNVPNAAVTCHCPGSTFEMKPHAWNHIFYPADLERGQDDKEDHFVPGSFVVNITDNSDVTFTAALGNRYAKPKADTRQRAKHLKPILKQLRTQNENQPREILALAIASDDFVVERTVGKDKLSTILAGYPWFADWGRDTFIALPGLLLCTGRHEEALKVLRAFAGCLRNGLIPNRFDDYQAHAQAAHYNTVDASLWFIHATFEYLRITEDNTSWKSFLRDAVTSIIEAYQQGTHADGHTAAGRAAIGADSDGLIAAGHDRSQLTWMDAAYGETVFTPRQGKAVEINALWYSALMNLAQRLPDEPRYAQLAKKVEQSFASTFWNEHLGCLYDHVYVDEHNHVQRNASSRPNQVFAISLPHSPLTHDQQEQVLECVREDLLVPMGLRTLPPSDPNYHAHYTGHQFIRDEAYHQGTTWPWLIGPYAEAVLRVGDFTSQAKRRARRAISPLLEHLLVHDDRPHSLGQLHEIFEAEPDTHARPVGCIAQAWSIAELLRVNQLIETAAPTVADVFL